MWYHIVLSITSQCTTTVSTRGDICEIVGLSRPLKFKLQESDLNVKLNSHGQYPCPHKIDLLKPQALPIFGFHYNIPNVFNF